ncbi:MAG: phosphoenolpyruvate carboxykinase (ATP) [candidate division WOR-3 bacterium]
MTIDLALGLKRVLESHPLTFINPDRRGMIQEVVENREAVVSACGALATWTAVESTGRSPADTVIVRHSETEHLIDWDSPNNLPITEETFDLILEDSLAMLERHAKLYVSDRALGSDPKHVLPVRTVSDRMLTILFADNMFRPLPPEARHSPLADKPFTLLVFANHKLDPRRYEGRLRFDKKAGRVSNMVIAMDFDNRVGVVYGSAYCGSVKKLMFTVMNYLLPDLGILPLHCSANEGPNQDVALFLGLSGTGKTSLSADPGRLLLGDDEHAWSDDGISNLENGCYAKLINLNPEKEPEIYHACFHRAHYLEHGAIIENAMMYPNGAFDLNDERLTPNSRGSYPLSFLPNTKNPPIGGHPRTIIFLTADANGVLPPIAKLTHNQAMLWFLLGYTSKLAGTETGIVEPKTTFSRFFGQPFMPRNPDIYAHLLGEKLLKHKSGAFLVNTGWSGGPYGQGYRMDIGLTRRLIHAALDGTLDDVGCIEDRRFHLVIPKSVGSTPLKHPRDTWADKSAYEARADKLAAEFRAHFEKNYSGKGIAEEVAHECPGPLGAGH